MPVSVSGFQIRFAISPAMLEGLMVRCLPALITLSATQAWPMVRDASRPQAGDVNPPGATAMQNPSLATSSAWWSMNPARHVIKQVTCYAR